MKDLLKVSLFILALIMLVAAFSLFPQNWSSVAAEQGAYPPPSSPSQPSDPIAYPPPENENIPVPTESPSENEPFVSLLEIEAEIESRKSLGFRSDIEYVEAVRSSDNAVIKGVFGGMVLTPNEAKELETRINLEEDGNALISFFENDPKLQDTFGGIYLEHAAGSEDETVGGQLVLQFVKDQMAVNELQKMLPPLQYPERLRIELVDFSNQHLEQQFRALSKAAPSHPEIQAVSLDQKNNRVDVMIAPSGAKKSPDGIVVKASLPNDLAILLADPAIIVGEGTVENTLEAVRGGDSWSDTSGGSNCTLGFKVKHNDTYAMLTAGHCIDILGISTGDPVYHNTTQIGTYSGFHKWGTSISNGTGIDAAILYMNDFLTAYEDVNYYSAYRDISGSTSTYVSGYWRCWTGKNSGTRCGEIGCTSLTIFDPTDSRYYTDVFTIDPTGVEGDSGGPAYRPLTNQTVDVTGIKSGTVPPISCSNGADSYFSKWHIIRDWWNLTLITGDAYLPLILK